MLRSQFTAWVRDDHGEAIEGADVLVCWGGTVTPVGDLYAAATGGSPLDPAVLTSDADGRVQGWTTNPKRVDLYTSNGGTAHYVGGALALPWSTEIQTIDIQPPPISAPGWDITTFVGVDPTGATDSTDGILAAIALVKVLGGVLYQPPNTTLTVRPGELLIDLGSSKFVQWRGWGPTSVVRCTSGTGAYIIKFYNAPASAIRDVELQVGGTAKITGAMLDIDCLTGSNTEHFDLYNVIFTNQHVTGERYARTASSTAGSNILTIDAADPPFTVADQGGMGLLAAAGPQGGPWYGLITEYISPTQVRLDTNATATVAVKTAHYFPAASAVAAIGYSLGGSLQAVTQDVSESASYGCKVSASNLYTSILVGGQYAGNVLNHRFFGCEARRGMYNVVAAGSGYKWIASTTQSAGQASHKLFGPASDSIVILGERDENSWRFWECVNNGSATTSVTIDGVAVTAIQDPSGKAVVHNSSVALTVKNSEFEGVAASIVFDLFGVSAAHPLHFRADAVGVQNAGDPFATGSNVIRTITGHYGIAAGLPIPSTIGVVFDQDVSVRTIGKGLRVKEGTNAKQGVATLVGGTVTVANTSVTATSRIFLTVQSLGTVAAPVAVAVTARVAATSFTITSADATDTSVVAWEIFEAA